MTKPIEIGIGVDCTTTDTILVDRGGHFAIGNAATMTHDESEDFLDNVGMCGGYPAPTCQKHRAVCKPNLAERIEKRPPLARTIDTDPAKSDLEQIFEGEHDSVEDPHFTRPHKHGDIFSHSYNGGGFDDVPARDSVKTALDVENCHLTEQAARAVFGIVVGSGNEPGTFVANLEATFVVRKEMRARRRVRALPVKARIAAEAEQVRARRFAPDARQMYAAAKRLSDRSRTDFTKFWGLDQGFDMIEGEKP